MKTGLQTVKQQRKLSEWAERVSACRSSGLSVKTWCRENGVSEQTYYKWQRRLYDLAQKQQENRFAEITPQAKSRSDIAVTVQTGSVELAIYNGADAATVGAGEFDGYAFPSLREGLPVAVMEAMASGLPVVCNDIRGCADLIEDGVNGLKLMECSPDMYATPAAHCRPASSVSSSNRSSTQPLSMLNSQVINFMCLFSFLYCEQAV